MTTVKKITTPEQMLAVQAAAEADDHTMLYPTHYVEKDGEIVGAWCINSVPTLHTWSHTEKMTAFDSIKLMPVADAIMQDRGTPTYITFVATHSPYFDKMGKLGFIGPQPTNLFLKET